MSPPLAVAPTSLEILALSKDFLVVAVDYSCHVGHAPIAYFDGISVEYLMEFAAAWKMFIKERKKTFTYVWFLLFYCMVD